MNGTLRRQSGAVLVISLIILLVMTVIGVTAMRRTTIEEKMAGNLRDRNLAFQAAEAALRDAQTWLADQAVPPEADDTASNGIWTMNAPGDVEDPDFDWATDGVEYGADTNAAAMVGLSAPPRYLIELQAYIPDSSSVDPEAAALGKGQYYYRVTGIGYGGSDTAESVLQATVVRDVIP